MAKDVGVKDVYGRFLDELDAMSIMSDEAAAAVVGRLTRAVRRAQMVYDGNLDSPVARGWAETVKPPDSKSGHEEER